MTIKKLIPCTLTAAVIASAALTGCSSKGTSDKSTTAAKTSAQETKETTTKSAETKDTEAGSSEVNTSAEAKSEEESKKAETELGSEEVSTEIGTGESADDLLAQIKERGNIVVAMEGTWAPWTYHDDNNDLVGYDVEVAQNIAEKLGVEVDCRGRVGWTACRSRDRTLRYHGKWCWRDKGACRKVQFLYSICI